MRRTELVPMSMKADGLRRAGSRPRAGLHGRSLYFLAAHFFLPPDFSCRRTSSCRRFLRAFFLRFVIAARSSLSFSRPFFLPCSRDVGLGDLALLAALAAAALPLLAGELVLEVGHGRSFRGGSCVPVRYRNRPAGGNTRGRRRQRRRRPPRPSRSRTPPQTQAAPGSGDSSAGTP